MTLTVDDLSCARGGRRVFAGATFRAEQGALLALKGPNGSGKSTLLRALAGLVSAAGRIAWNGAVLAEDRDAYQEAVAYAGHLDAVKPSLTVRENLAFWARLMDGAGAGGAARRASAALERFGLAEIADDPAAFCSAGQKRRLGLARLAAVDRPLWLLDEPTVSLDVDNVAAVADLLDAHCAGGGVAIVATHIDFRAGAVETLDMSAFAVGRGLAASAGGAGDADDPFLDPALAGR